jgi:hypothetical protein
MKFQTVIFLILLLVPSAWGQIVIKAGDDVTPADLRVRVGEDVTLADVRLRIGPEVTMADFTVGITDEKSKAHFVVTEGLNYDLRVRAGDSVTLADIRIRAGDSVTLSDVRVKIKTSGTVDYLVYIDKEQKTMADLVVALLPAINKKLGYKLEDVPRIK